MSKNHITIRIISTIPDMVAEHYYFIKHVFPDLKEICLDHDIVLDYVDLFYSMTEKEFNSCRSVLNTSNPLILTGLFMYALEVRN